MFLTLRCRRLRPGHRCRVGLNPLSTNLRHIILKGTNLPGTQPPVATTHISDRAVATVKYTTWAGEPTKKAKLDQSPSMPYLRGESEGQRETRTEQRNAATHHSLDGWIQRGLGLGGSDLAASAAASRDVDKSSRTSQTTAAPKEGNRIVAAPRPGLAAAP